MPNRIDSLKKLNSDAATLGPKLVRMTVALKCMEEWFEDPPRNHA
jgi:hypothetical protein